MQRPPIRSVRRCDERRRPVNLPMVLLADRLAASRDAPTTWTSMASELGFVFEGAVKAKPAQGGFIRFRCEQSKKTGLDQRIRSSGGCADSG